VTGAVTGAVTDPATTRPAVTDRGPSVVIASRSVTACRWTRSG